MKSLWLGMILGLFLSGTLRAWDYAPCKEVAAEADVIFRAIAGTSEGAHTTMKVVEVIKGDMPIGQIVFNHSASRQRGGYGPRRQYYTLVKGRTYLIRAKRTSRANVFSQLYGTNYCSESVEPDKESKQAS